MKKLIVFMAVMMTWSATFAAAPGEPIQDQGVVDIIRQRYNGTWIGRMEGQIAAETLKDGRILIEASDRLAEYAFYNIPLAQESVQYIPPAVRGSYLNFFDRLGKSINCGQSSFDLKNSPFPTFKCRFAVDADGNVVPFLDRTAATSNAKPTGFDGKWEAGTMDFHWRKVVEMSGDSNGYSEAVRSSNDPVAVGTESFHLQFFGKAGLEMYNKLNAQPTKGWWGPNTSYLQKTGKQIWCIKVDGQSDSAKCRIGFDFAGEAQTAKAE